MSSTSSWVSIIVWRINSSFRSYSTRSITGAGNSLAKAISDNIEIVGRRPGEKRDEDLISEHELSYTYVKGNDIHIRAEENTYDKKLEVPYNSHSAEKMTSKQIKELVEWN